MKILHSILPSLSQFKIWVRPFLQREKETWNEGITHELRHSPSEIKRLRETEMDRLIKSIEEMKSHHIHTH